MRGTELWLATTPDSLRSILLGHAGAWNDTPAKCETAIEAVTGRARAQLRVEQGFGQMTTNETGDIGTLRAREYLMLASLLRFPAKQELLDKLAAITSDASPLGIAHVQLAEAAARTDERSAGREFFNLFIGVGRGELLPYASFYLTGFLNERPLGRVREDLARLGIQRADGNFDPEDHIATLLETMAGLASCEIQAEAETDKAFFERHLKPWSGRFFADLGVAPSATFYRAVAGVGLAFIGIETEAFTLPDTAGGTY